MATINENHARELLELHTVSPKAEYTQNDVIQLSYIMTGWEHEYTDTRLECNPVKFNWEKHERGSQFVLGHKVNYRGSSSQNKLFDVIKFLSNHKSSRNFICKKLCQHFITDQPTVKMIEPIVKTWEKSGGNLPDIHEAVIREAYRYAPHYKKFFMPETWFLQIARIGGLSWPPTEREMKYNFDSKPTAAQRRPENILRELGHNPFRPTQPNGFPDMEREWLSPELLIRRLVVAHKVSTQLKGYLVENDELKELIIKNFDNQDQVFNSVRKLDRAIDKLVMLFCGPWMLKA